MAITNDMTLVFGVALFHTVELTFHKNTPIFHIKSKAAVSMVAGMMIYHLSEFELNILFSIVSKIGIQFDFLPASLGGVFCVV